MALRPLSTKLLLALANQPERTVIEDGGGEWQLTAEQLFTYAALLFEQLEPHAEKTLIAYVRKSLLYYALTACCFLNRLNFCPLDIENPIYRVLDVASQLPDALIICDEEGTLARLRHHTEKCFKIQVCSDHSPSEYKNDTGRTNEASYYIATSGSTGVPKLVKAP
jgi:non-ribosomal peptide synthetase component F